MSEPVFALIIFAIIMTALLAFFWPKKGLSARLRQAKKDKMRILTEDCLKFLYNCEYRQVPCAAADITAAFSISDEETGILLERLLGPGLVESTPAGLNLTKSGRTHALQMVRIHRLLEKYLSEETSLGESEWHPAAEDREHILSADEADELAARLGNPVYDPHGDPIPTAAGDMPEHQGILLPELKQSQTIRILHIEDEPPHIYKKIISLDLHPGLEAHAEPIPEGFKLLIHGVSRILPSELADNITVLPLEAGETPTRPLATLSTLQTGDSARVLGISKACRGQQRRRLMDLGVVPGSVISAEMKSVGGDPTAYLIRGALIALRKQQSDHIYIENN
jgi:DtxR family Mn-dependent transcriptional regulator